MPWFSIDENGGVEEAKCEKCECDEDLFYDDNGTLLCADCHFDDFCEVISD